VGEGKVKEPIEPLLFGIGGDGCGRGEGEGAT
jgi:hypothetical protein